jgi:hypothetical protein
MTIYPPDCMTIRRLSAYLSLPPVHAVRCKLVTLLFQNARPDKRSAQVCLSPAVG